MELRQVRRHHTSNRALSLLLCFATALFASGARCRGGGQAGLPVRPGLPAYQESAVLTLQVTGQPQVNMAAGGNLVLRRLDLSIDTRVLAPFEMSAVYNGGTQEWRHSFDLEYAGGVFIDPEGSVHDVAGLADGERIPGTRWVKLDALRVKTQGGLVHEFSSGDGRLRFLYWSSAALPRIEFLRSLVAGKSVVHTIRQCRSAGCESVASLSADTQGRVVQIVDRAGRVASFDYASNGQLVAARDGLDHARGWPGFRYGYDAAGKLTSLRNSEDEEVAFDWKGLRVEAVRAIAPGEADPEFRFTHWSLGGGLYAARVVNPLGHPCTFTFDGQARLLEMENAVGERETWTWQDQSLASHSDRAGLVTSWVESDDQLEEHSPAGNLTTRIYAPFASNTANRNDRWERPLLSEVDLVGPIESRGYDTQGRNISIALGDEAPHRFEWDEDSQLTKVIAPSGETQARFSVHDEHGHPQLVSYTSHQEVREYDAVGNQRTGQNVGSGPAAHFDPGVPGTHRLTFDEDRNVAVMEVSATHDGIVDELGTLDLSYRSDGQRSAILRPYGGDALFDYDALGRLVERREKADGVFRSTQLEYDVAGNLTGVEQPNGMRWETDPDPVNRPLQMRVLRDGVQEQQVDWLWQQGRLVLRSDSAYPSGSEAWSYDASGQLASHYFPGGERVDFSWDLRNRVQQESFFSPLVGSFRTLAYSHDANDRVSEVRDQGQVILARSYRPDGRDDQIVYGNGLERSFDYDDGAGGSGALLGSETRMASNGALVAESTSQLSRNCTLSAWICHDLETTTWAGVQETVIERHRLGPVPENLVLHLYAAAPRATMWDVEDPLQGGGVGSQGILYDYDLLGNAEIRPAGAASDFVFNAERNRLISGAGHSYSYDEAGYVTSRDGVAFSWHAAGQIASIGSQLQFEWDAQGRAVRQVIEGHEQLFLFGGRVLAPASRIPSILRIDNDVEVDLASGDRLYRHFDSRGNTRFVTDDSGDVSQLYQYSAYGVETVHGPGDDLVHFAQGRGLADTGLVWVGFRIYDPAVGRFLSPDPIYNPLSQHTYTAGNPMWFSDRDGQSAVIGLFVAFAIIFAFVAGAVFGRAMSEGRVLTVEAGPVSISDSPATQGEEGSEVSALGSAAAAAGAAGCSPTNLDRVPYPRRGFTILLAMLMLLGGALFLQRRRLSTVR